MKKKLLAKASTVCEKAHVMATGAVTIGMLAMNNIAMAASGQEVLKKILELLCKILIPFGIILGIMGVVHYASAKSEGDGPASNKAIGQIAAGVMIIVLSTAILSMGFESLMEG